MVSLLKLKVQEGRLFQYAYHPKIVTLIERGNNPLTESIILVIGPFLTDGKYEVLYNDIATSTITKWK